MSIAIIYHMVPHYRRGVVRALDHEGRYEYAFYGRSEPFEGIKALERSEFKRFVEASFIKIGRIYWQPAALAVAFNRRFDVVVYLGNPNFLSTWVGAALCRLTGKKVVFWTHGWLKTEGKAKTKIRTLFYRTAHAVMVYGERSKEIGMALGFDPSKIAPVYNSLDYDASVAVRQRIESDGPVIDPRSFFGAPEWPLIICTARLTKLCRFDLLIESVRILKLKGFNCNVLLVGDGPEKKALVDQAHQNGVDVVFYGACYDEAILGSFLYFSDVTVSPGKVGLTAIHSLSYGTPVITHGDFDDQMPEVESIQPGVSGDFFVKGDAEDLADKIRRWLGSHDDRAGVRSLCLQVIHEKWNPHNQVLEIERTIDRVRMGGGLV